MMHHMRQSRQAEAEFCTHVSAKSARLPEISIVRTWPPAGSARAIQIAGNPSSRAACFSDFKNHLPAWYVPPDNEEGVRSAEWYVPT